MSYEAGCEGMLNSVLTEAITDAAAVGRELTLPHVDRTMVLCMIRRDPKDCKEGSMTLTAKKRQKGIIVLGPYATRREKPSRENLDRFLQAHRWVLNPVRDGDGIPDPSTKIVRHPHGMLIGPPTISLMHRIETKCVCGHIEREHKDVVIMRSKPANGSNHRVTHWSPDIITDCNKCGSEPVTQRKLRCTAIRNDELAGDDPVIDNDEREERLETMLDAWKDGPPQDGEGAELPRIWAVYKKDQVPDPSWQPTDVRAKALVKRAAAYEVKRIVNGAEIMVPYPLGVLPYGIAKAFHQPPVPISLAVQQYWLECAPVWTGWVPKCELYPSRELGFKRRLWHDSRVFQNTDTDMLV